MESSKNMINKKISVKEIEFNYVEYKQDLYESIKERGVSIPVKVLRDKNGYKCIDGHKRLSILQDLHIETVTIMLKNDFSKAGSGYWGNTRNKH